MFLSRDSLCFICHHLPATEVKMWSCAAINTVYAQRSYITVMQLTFAEWRSTFKCKIHYKAFSLSNV